MPTQKSIPERYPVLEHMEARLRTEGRLPASRPAGRSFGWVGALVLGAAGGAMLVVAFVAVVQAGA